MLQLRLLGSPKISLNNVSVAEALSSKAQAILYYLAVTGQPQTRPALAALLWGDMPEEAARTNLRKALANLRETLGNQLDIDRRTVAFQAGSATWVDVVEFKAHLDAAADIRRLQAAVALYQGDFLAGFYVLHAPDFETWLLAEQARLRELVVQALHTLAGHLAGQGELAEAIAYTRQLLSLEPWREEAHRQLMELLAQVGQRSAALAQYEICRQMLAEELGVEPDRETINLYERIREGKINRGDRFTSAPPPLASPGHFACSPAASSPAAHLFHWSGKGAGRNPPPLARRIRLPSANAGRAGRHRQNAVGPGRRCRGGRCFSSRRLLCFSGSGESS